MFSSTTPHIKSEVCKENMLPPYASLQVKKDEKIQEADHIELLPCDKKELEGTQLIEKGK